MYYDIRLRENTQWCKKTKNAASFMMEKLFVYFPRIWTIIFILWMLIVYAAVKRKARYFLQTLYFTAFLRIFCSLHYYFSITVNSTTRVAVSKATYNMISPIPCIFVALNFVSGIKIKEDTKDIPSDIAKVSTIALNSTLICWSIPCLKNSIVSFQICM